MSKKEESTPTTPKKTKATEENKSEAPKAEVKKDQKEKKASKPKAEKKKVVKKSDKKPKSASKPKTTTKKGTKKVKKPAKASHKEKSTESKSGLTTYEEYVFEAISAKATEDKEWVGFNTISGYIHQYIEEVKPGSIARYARSAADKLYEREILKKKKDSYAIAKKGKKIDLSFPKRKTVRTPSVKGEKRLATEEKTDEYLTVTQSGRVSKKLITV